MDMLADTSILACAAASEQSRALTSMSRKGIARPDRLMAGEARPHHGRRERPFDRLGHRQVRGRQGAELAFTYQGEAFGRRATPLARSLGLRVSSSPATWRTSPRRCTPSRALDGRWDGLDFVVHAIGFSDKAQLRGRYVDVRPGTTSPAPW